MIPMPENVKLYLYLAETIAKTLALDLAPLRTIGTVWPNILMFSCPIIVEEVRKKLHRHSYIRTKLHKAVKILVECQLVRSHCVQI